MVISFFGHRRFYWSDDLIEGTVVRIETLSNGANVEFFLGAYGDFDSFGLACALAYKKMHPLTKLCFVSPYNNEIYFKNKCVKDWADEVIYPGIENTPPKYAIIKRNEWIVENSDFIFFYVASSFGGAYTALQHAKRKNVNHANFYKKKN